MYDGMGHSVSSSEDGKIVAMGAPYLKNNAGEVHVKYYDEEERTWKRMGRPIQGLNHGDFFGFDVALNAKGNTLIASSPTAKNARGFVTVFTFDDYSQRWEQIGQPIEGKYDEDEFGFAVAMSETGNYVAIGAPYATDNPGRVEVYKYSDEEWHLHGSEIQGESNGDEAGETIDILEHEHEMHEHDLYVAVGAPMDLDTEGTATVFKYIHDAGDWEMMDRYVDGDDVGTDLGRSVSLGYDGFNVILAVGFPGPGIDANSDPLSGVQVYKIDPEYNWNYYGQMIFPFEADDGTGSKVSLSKDGQTLAIASPQYSNGKGMATVYVFNGQTYEQIGDHIIGDDDEEIGFSMNLSRNGMVLTLGSLAGRYVVSYSSGPWVSSYHLTTSLLDS